MAETITDASALTTDTPGSILFGAGTLRYGVTVDDATGAITAEGTIMGCTNGGGKISIKPNLVAVEVDQSSVARKGLYVKDGEEATMEFNLVEIKAADVPKLTLGTAAAGTACKVVTSAEAITTDHYYTGLAFVGHTVDGKPVIARFGNAICTSGLELEAKKGESATPSVSFACVADLASGTDTLPWTVVWPTVTA